jgi:hypothetical protein
MGNLKKVVVIFSILLCSVSAFAEGPSFGADIYFNTKSIWRGNPFTEKPVFSADIWAYWESGFTISAWGAADMTDERDQRADIYEIDVNLDYKHYFDAAIFGAGLVYYTYMIDPGNDVETYLYGSSNMDVFNFGAKAYFDLQRASLYLAPEISVGYTFADLITPSLTLFLGLASPNYYSYQYGLEKDFSVNDLTTSLDLGIGLPGNIGEVLSFSIGLTYATIFDEDIETAMDIDKGNFDAGLTVSAAF